MIFFTQSLPVLGEMIKGKIGFINLREKLVEINRSFYFFVTNVTIIRSRQRKERNLGLLPFLCI